LTKAEIRLKIITRGRAVLLQNRPQATGAFPRHLGNIFAAPGKCQNPGIRERRK
jgi:hypothetical protein